MPLDGAATMKMCRPPNFRRKRGSRHGADHQDTEQVRESRHAPRPTEFAGAINGRNWAPVGIEGGMAIV